MYPVLDGGGGGGFGGGGGPGIGGGAGGFGGGGGTGAGALHPPGVGGFGGGAGAGLGGGGAGLGGAIFNMGTGNQFRVGGNLYYCGSVFMTDCTLTGNSAQGGKGGDLDTGSIPGNGGSGYGGAVFNLDGVLRLDEDTLDQNQVSGGGSGFAIGSSPGGADGSDVYNLAYGNYILGGSFVSAHVFLVNDILADGPPGIADLASDKSNGKGPNLAIIDGSTNLITSTHITNTIWSPNTLIKTSASPNLGPLKDNGGPLTTLTMAVAIGSPAFGAGDPNAPGLPPTDQRGFARVVKGQLDLGAYENRRIANGAGARPPDLGRLNDAFGGDLEGRVGGGHVVFSMLGQNLVAPVQDGTGNATLAIPGDTASTTLPGAYSITVAYTDGGPDEPRKLREAGTSTTPSIIPVDLLFASDWRPFGSGN
jgi:hypothetical protein